MHSMYPYTNRQQETGSSQRVLPKTNVTQLVFFEIQITEALQRRFRSSEASNESTIEFPTLDRTVRIRIFSVRLMTVTQASPSSSHACVLCLFGFICSTESGGSGGRTSCRVYGFNPTLCRLDLVSDDSPIEASNIQERWTGFVR